MLDTDLGTNVDDLLALALVATAPEVDLVAVTTVSGRTDVRAALAARALAVFGRPEVPVVAGAASALSGRPPRWTGRETDGVRDAVAPDLVAAPEGSVGVLPDTAEEALVALGEQHGGDLEVVAIGPLTNLAEARRRSPAWVEQVRRLWVMGGNFGPGGPDHNLRADAVAAAEVLDGGWDLYLCGWEVTTRAWLDEPRLRVVVGREPTAATRFLAAAVRRYWAGEGRSGSHPHDLVAAAAALWPERFRWAATAVAVATDGPDEGGLVVGQGTVVNRVVAAGEGVVEDALFRLAGAAGGRSRAEA